MFPWFRKLFQQSPKEKIKDKRIEDLNELEKAVRFFDADSYIQNDGDFVRVGSHTIPIPGLFNYEIKGTCVELNYYGGKSSSFNLAYRGFDILEIVDRADLEYVKERLLDLLEKRHLKDSKDSRTRSVDYVPMNGAEKVKANAEKQRKEKEREEREKEEIKEQALVRAEHIRKHVRKLYRKMYIPHVDEKGVLHTADQCFAANTVTGWGKLAENEFVIYIVSMPVVLAMDIKINFGQVYKELYGWSSFDYDTSLRRITESVLEKHDALCSGLSYKGVFSNPEDKAEFVRDFGSVLDDIVAKNRRDGIGPIRPIPEEEE